jgi:nicotinamide mononucleotide (NMN) deamidase PncC
MTTIDASTMLQGSGAFVVKTGLMVVASANATVNATASAAATCSCAMEVMAGATATVQAGAALAFSGMSSLKGELSADAMGTVQFAGLNKKPPTNHSLFEMKRPCH